MADTKISALPAVAVPAVGDEFACNQAGVTKKETKAQITAATDANLTAHVAVTAAGVHGSSVAAAVDTLAHRDGAGRTQFVNPAAAQDASTKSYCDAQTHVAGYGALISPAGITDRTRTIWIGAGAMLGGLAGATLTFTLGTAVGHLAWLLDDATDTTLFCSCQVPMDYATGNMTVKLWWTADVVAGNARFQYDALAQIAGEDVDVAADVTAIGNFPLSGQKDVTVSTIGVGASGIPVTADDVIFLNIWRRGTDVADTIGASVYVFGLELEYTADS